ncbi:MAG: hypothetical protein KKA32_05650 [Actinobacteria bacterium]|nr:hypothetical protein [Actinomycetota bacterium]
MGSALVLGVLFLFLSLILAGMLRGLDWDALSRTKGGLLSKSGVRAVVGGGFLVGLVYGLFVGSQSGSATWIWVSRGVIDGLVVACAGAFYLGYQQRKTMRDSAPVEGAGSEADPVVDLDAPPAGAPPPQPPADEAESAPGRPAGDDHRGGDPVP